MKVLEDGLGLSNTCDWDVINVNKPSITEVGMPARHSGARSMWGHGSQEQLPISFDEAQTCGFMGGSVNLTEVKFLFE